MATMLEVSFLVHVSHHLSSVFSLVRICHVCADLEGGDRGSRAP